MVQRWQVIGAVAALALTAWLWRTPSDLPFRSPEWTGAAAALQIPVQAFSSTPRQRLQAQNGVEDFERWLRARSSLQGAELDGDWGSMSGGGALVPTRSVRYRFDQLLLLQGEVELEEISSYVEAASVAALGQEGGRQLSALWRKYVELLSRRYDTHIRVGEPEGWATALKERQAARREVLGKDWAEHFFGDEERSFEELVRRTIEIPSLKGPDKVAF